MIVQHPARSGWLIVTPGIEQLLNVEHRLILPDGSAVHPLYFHPADFEPGELDKLKAWALDYLNTWRGARRAALGLTPAAFQELVYTGKVLESQRWLAAPESSFGLAAEAAARGLTNEQMASLVIGKWAAWSAGSDGIEAEYITARAAVSLAESVEEIAAVLAGLS